MVVEFRVLGPVEARLDGRPLPLGPRQQAILAVLLVEPNRLVSREHLLHRAWGEKLPTRPANAVQTQLTLLRRALAPIPDVTITWQSTGYRLTVDESTIDLHRFRGLVRRARTGTQCWDDALGLWRGAPFTGIDLPWFDSLRTNLLIEQHAAALDRTDVMLRLGQHDAVLPALAAQAQAHPLDERLAGQLMLALHKAGRTAEALRHYDALRDDLVDELGADPGTELRDLHGQLLGTDPPVPAAPIPRQLPASPSSFTGRARELAALTAILDTATRTGGTVVISAVSGTGGIGKTWLTLYWAHRHRDRFPDGQLFVDLRGFSPEGRPMAPATAVRGFLDALGVPATQIPAGTDAQAALLRTLLAETRMLIVLDNAANTEQVLPLLPGGSNNTVLINSRDHLAGLLSGHGAHRVDLDILSDVDAREMLSRRLGPARVAAEPDAVDELLHHCAGFPLALSIVVGHALSHPDFPLTALATDLRNGRLTALDDEEPGTGLPSVLSWSYAALPPEQARAFGLLGIAPGPDISLMAAAGLLDRSVQETRGILRGLVRASLLRQAVPDRYTMHDLVRAYAREQAGAETEPALRRVVDFYLHSAYAAEATTNSPRPTITLPEPAAGARPRDFAGLDEAMAWFTDEYPNLAAAQHEAAGREWHELTWRLAWTLSFHRSRTGRLLDNIDMWRIGLAAARQLGDPAVEAIARQQSGAAFAQASRFADAREQFTESTRLAVGIGDVVTELFNERFLCALHVSHQRLGEAESHARRALALSEDIGNPTWLGAELTHIAWVAANRGDYEYAKSYGDRALAMQRQHASDDHTGMGNLLDCLGFIANGMGRHEAAIDYYHRALAEYAVYDNVYYQVETLEHIGHPYRALGQPERAREAWREALRICREQKRSADARRIEALLDELPAG